MDNHAISDFRFQILDLRIAPRYSFKSRLPATGAGSRSLRLSALGCGTRGTVPDGNGAASGMS